MVSFDCSIDAILPAQPDCGPEVDSTPNRNQYQDPGRHVRLTDNLAAFLSRLFKNFGCLDASQPSEPHVAECFRRQTDPAEVHWLDLQFHARNMIQTLKYIPIPYTSAPLTVTLPSSEVLLHGVVMAYGRGRDLLKIVIVTKVLEQCASLQPAVTCAAKCFWRPYASILSRDSHIFMLDLRLSRW
jgi:hypothetical protein